ncbi:chemotaxis protein CheC [Duganella sp. Root198D2]|uniref:chemotaxis protein CheC n=1 Tax=Duganella sp. Root198D2 TaxID=1736489 RepID=UPI00070C1F43|nr:chemotaxis protein CheC [Duganella sp. Root198D2]KRC03431.1 chemotaxis protein CheC [Duganella sp. Root198D2]
MVRLTELEHDALVELFNIGVGQAASAMSEIVNETVTMSVPAISFLTRATAAKLLTSRSGGNGRLCGISQHYSGAFETEAILMFPEEKSQEIVRLMVGEAMPLAELSAMEQEAMSEIGNILLNSCVGSLANLLGHELHGSLPDYHLSYSEEILALAGSGETAVLMLHIEFVIERQQIAGDIAFIMDVTALHGLKQHVAEFLDRSVGGAQP